MAKQKGAKRLNKEYIKEVKEKSRLGELRLACCVCGIEEYVTTSRPELYTDDIRKKFKCVKHKYGFGGEKWNISKKK